MAEIANYLFFRHLRAEPSSHVIQYKNGRQRRSGRAASFWFRPLDTAVVEVPVDDRELSFIFHGRSADFQDVTVQGVLTYRVVEPALLAERVDFGIDLRNGRHLREPLEQLSDMLSALAQQFALDDIARAGVRELLIDGHERIRRRVREGLLADDALSGLGLELVAVRVAAIRPTADLEKALEAPTRETIQQAADEAGFARRALAVEKERAIAENELQNRIELAKREQVLITERGANERKRAEEKAEAGRIAAEGHAQCARLAAAGQAESLRLVEQAKVEAERERMAIHRDLPAQVIFGLAAQELAGKLQRIDHLNLSPDAFGPLLTNLLRAGTARLEAAEADREADRDREER
ncbi:MAG: band 7 protein [Myxococcales bacterium]|nr:band 7 protein [Myxococcales bacterium]